MNNLPEEYDGTRTAVMKQEHIATVVCGDMVDLDEVSRLNSLGVCHAEGGRYDEAVQCLSSALKLLQRMACPDLPYLAVIPPARTELCREDSHGFLMSAWQGLPSALGLSVCDVTNRRHREYDEGMNVFPALVSCNRSTFDELVVMILYNFGETRLRQGYFLEAYHCFLDVLLLAQSTTGKALHNLLVPALHKVGFIQYQIGDIQKSIATFTKALHYCRYGGSQIQTAATYNCLGVLYFHLPISDTAKALENLTRALSMQTLLLGSESLAVATTLNNIGRVHYIASRFDEALAAYLECLRIRRKMLRENHIDIAAAAYNAGQALQHKGCLQEALQFYDEFIRISVPQLGQSHRDVAYIFKCMAQIHHLIGDHDAALTTYIKALFCFRAALGTHAEVASTLNKLGNLYYERGDYTSAIEMYRQGLEVERSVYDGNHPNITVTLSNIAQIYKDQGDLSAALMFYKEALSIQVAAVGTADPTVASTLSNMGAIHYQKKNYQSALALYQEALRIRREAFGDENLEVASSLNSIGLVLFRLGVYDIARETFSQSLRLRRSLLGESHRDVAVILYNIATIELELGNEDEALKYYEETLRVEKIVLGPKHADLVVTLQFIAQVHQQRGELHEAIAYYNEAIEVMLSNVTGEHDKMKVARMMNSMANMHLQLGNTASAMDILVEAVRMAKSCGRDTEELSLSGFTVYGLAKLHPETAAAA